MFSLLCRIFWIDVIRSKAIDSMGYALVLLELHKDFKNDKYFKKTAEKSLEAAVEYFELIGDNRPKSEYYYCYHYSFLASGNVDHVEIIGKVKEHRDLALKRLPMLNNSKSYVFALLRYFNVPRNGISC